MSLFTVLGSSGIVGNRLSRRLAGQGCRVFEPKRGDLSVFKRPLGHVFYCIGLTADFRTRPFDTIEAHISVLANLLQKGNYQSLLYLSSTRVYSGAKSTCEDTELKVNPHNLSDLYNLSKLTGESLCRATGLDSVKVARLSNVVHGNDEGSHNFIPSLRREAKSGHIFLRSAVTSAKDYIHIDDAVETLINICLKGKYFTYNVASGIQIPHSKWIDYFTTQYGCSVDIASDAPETTFMPIDNTRIRQEFEFRPREILAMPA